MSVCHAAQAGFPRSPRLGALLAIGCAVLVSLAAPRTLHAQGTLHDLAFMAGCWRSVSGDASEGVIEDRWSTPTGGLILGTTRYFQLGLVVQFEFTTIRADSAGVVMTPYPRGFPSEHGFRLTRSGPGGAVFEAPEHDYPKRISYHLDDLGALIARIDGGEGSTESSEWRMPPIACRPGSD